MQNKSISELTPEELHDELKDRVYRDKYGILRLRSVKHKEPPSPDVIKARADALHYVFKKYFNSRQIDMANELNVSRAAVSAWFARGYIGMRSARLLSEKLDIPIQKLRPDK